MRFTENSLIEPDGNMNLTVGSLTEKNSIIDALDNITLRNVNWKLYGFDKTYMDKDIIEN